MATVSSALLCFPIRGGENGRPEPISDGAGVEEADAIEEEVARLCLCLCMRGSIWMRGAIESR